MSKLSFEGNTDDWIDFLNQSKKILGTSGSARIRKFIKKELGKSNEQIKKENNV